MNTSSISGARPPNYFEEQAEVLLRNESVLSHTSVGPTEELRFSNPAQRREPDWYLTGVLKAGLLGVQKVLWELIQAIFVLLLIIAALAGAAILIVGPMDRYVQTDNPAWLLWYAIHFLAWILYLGINAKYKMPKR